VKGKSSAKFLSANENGTASAADAVPCIGEDFEEIVRRSAERYLRAIGAG